MIEAIRPSRTAASNGASCSSTSSRRPTWTGAWFSPPSASPCPTMCFPVAATPSASDGPWIPRTYARPITVARYGSSPYVSSTRPQRGSRVVSITGASAWRAPISSIRRRRVVAIASTSSGSNEAAAPIDCWNTGAPRPSTPWSDSSWTIAGIPSRVSSTRNRWISLPRAAASAIGRVRRPRHAADVPDPLPEQLPRPRRIERPAPHQLERPRRAQLRDLLAQRHARQQVGRPHLHRQRRIPVPGLGRRHQPFTAPVVSPPTSCRSATK